MSFFLNFHFPSFTSAHTYDAATICKQIGQDHHLPTSVTTKLSHLLSLDLTNKNYQVQLDELYQEISPDMAESLKKMSQQLRTDAVAQKTLKSLIDAITIKKKWQELKLDPEWINHSFQDAAFLVKTRLIYSILGFQNSTLEGFQQNEIKVQLIPGLNQKELWIKKQGKWTAVSQIRKEIQWSANAHALVSKNNAVERWNYFSNQGLMPIHTAYEKHLIADSNDSNDHARMHPVTKLSQQEMDKLLTHAKHFDTHSTSVLDHSSIKGAIQFVTHPDLAFDQPYLQNLNAQMKTHCGIRLITPDGDVYSFGFGGDFQEHLLKNQSSQCLATINGQPKILDYLEFQKYTQRLVTTIPLTQKQTEEILNQLNFYRANGVRFNILKQNCVRFGTHLLKFADISLDTRVSLIRTAWRSLPNVEHFPLVGNVLGSVKKNGQKVWQVIAAKIPSFIKQIFAHIAAFILYIPHQLITCLLNFGLIMLGGKMGSANSSLELEQGHCSGQIENFDTLVSNLFDSQAAYVHHSSIFIQWQLNQTSTEVYQYSGQPSMNLLPPASHKEKSFSNQQKQKLQAIYQECTEV